MCGFLTQVERGPFGLTDTLGDLPDGQISDFRVQPSREKYSAFRFGRNSNRAKASRPTQRGVTRTSRTLGRDAMDAAVRETGDANADGEVVWS
jgi:hypothetical protein